MRRLGLALLLCLVACVAPPEQRAGGFLLIAHRGASAYAPENTLPAFAVALEQGALHLELDVQRSRDGVVVLFHDETLDEKTALRGRVGEHAADALLRADVGAWFDRTRPDAERRFGGTPLVSLDVVFARFGRTPHYHVEMKSREPELPGEILALARRHGLADRITLTSFHRESLRWARAQDPRVPITWLLDAPTPARMTDAAEAGFDGVGVRAAELTLELVAAARGRGLGIRAWEVGSTELLEHAVRVGADGATVDWPDRARRALEALEGERP